jgi:hypothetical protein
MGKYSKKAEATGSQSVLRSEKEYKEYKKILDTVMNPEEFDKIWKVVPAGAKLNFILNSMKYVFKEKGKETEIEVSTVENQIREIVQKQTVLEKLLETKID